MNIFVTGTDTDVGKTTISAWLCMHTDAFYWKPVQTGSNSDSEVIEKFSPHTRIIPEVYKLKAPLSPYDAAKMENLPIDEKLFKQEIDYTIIEGAGGALVPLKPGFHMADLITFYKAKTIIVAKSKLGVINHLLMTVEVLRSRNVEILGIIVTGEIEDNIKQTIELFSGLKILVVMSFSDNLNEVLQSSDIPLEILEVFQ